MLSQDNRGWPFSLPPQNNAAHAWLHPTTKNCQPYRSNNKPATATAAATTAAAATATATKAAALSAAEDASGTHLVQCTSQLARGPVVLKKIIV